jgi:Flp pilus assembly protein TadG
MGRFATVAAPPGGGRMYGMKRDERGASAVEFALLAPILFMLVFGIIQLGMAYHRQQGLEAASREGARTASIGATQTEINDRVRAAQSLFQSADVAIDYSYSANNGTSYTTIAASGSNRPCATGGIGSLVKIDARVAPPASPNQDRYAISLLFVGNWTPTYTATGVFRCEKNN